MYMYIFIYSCKCTQIVTDLFLQFEDLYIFFFRLANLLCLRHVVSHRRPVRNLISQRKKQTISVKQ